MLDASGLTIRWAYLTDPDLPVSFTVRIRPVFFQAEPIIITTSAEQTQVMVPLAMLTLSTSYQAEISATNLLGSSVPVQILFSTAGMSNGRERGYGG